MFRVCSLRSLAAACALFALVAIAATPVSAGGLDLAILDQLEAPPVRVLAAAPLDLSSLDGLERPLAAVVLDLSVLDQLDAKPAPPPAAKPVSAAPPPAVPATTAGAGTWQQQCGPRGCRLVRVRPR